MNLYTLHVGLLGKILFKTAYIYDSHDLYVGQNHMTKAKSFSRKLVMQYEKFLSTHADAVLQTTQSRGDKFHEWYPGMSQSDSEMRRAA